MAISESDEDGDVSAEGEEGIMPASPSIVFFSAGEGRVESLVTVGAAVGERDCVPLEGFR